MYKNQLQELAQRSCFGLPSYTCLREGPDHAPRFKATVNFNGEIFESPQYCSTLRQAEHSAAEVALGALSNRGPSHSLAARILDETGVYKNLLQEIAQRVGAPLPRYTTFRSGLGHQPVFTGTVELAGITFTGDSAKNKKQAEKNAAMAAWSSLKQLAKETSSSMPEPDNTDELEQVIIARALINYRIKENIGGSGSSSAAPVPFAKKFFMQNLRPTSPQPSPATTSRILPFICPKPSSRTSRSSVSASSVERAIAAALDNRNYRPPQQRFAANPGTAGAPPYVPMRHLRSPCNGMAPPVTIRTAVPVFSAPPMPPPPCTNTQQQQQQQPSVYVPSMMRSAPPVRIAPPVTMRTAVPVFASAPQIRKEEALPVRKVNIQTSVKPVVQEREERAPILPDNLEIELEGSGKPVSETAKETERAALKDDFKGEHETVKERLENLKIW
ncbi:Double-stranded RNA-binding protein 2 [Raphanus sativus]|uniref:Double-stranded RNA-binding protein 2 n=1 Tax=Raphanus sativus TaxID=3726 RepID=A0A6J0NIM7_RAPSA|nr:double-stranded RNA-binding protein 2 [Raphanus sativus]KAJ4903154.1 Double-stranded RNA-binding protein 2 [Raphanus sativus]